MVCESPFLSDNASDSAPSMQLDTTLARLLSERLAGAEAAVRIGGALWLRLDAESQTDDDAWRRAWSDELLVHLDDHVATTTMLHEALSTTSASWSGAFRHKEHEAELRCLAIVEDSRETLFRVLHAVLVTKRMELSGWQQLVAECMKRQREGLAEQCQAAQQRVEDTVAMLVRWLDELERARPRRSDVRD